MKLEDKHPILKLIPFDKKITKQELIASLNMDERTVRNLINKARKDTAILSNSKEKGYRRAKHTDMLITQQDVINELNEIEHSINEINSRINDYNYQKRALIAHKKVIEKRLDTANIKPQTKPINIISNIIKKVKLG